MTETTRKTADWERIEADYRAGVLSLREIAGQHGLSHGAINKRAKRDGWTRDLSAKIKAKADLLVSKAAVSAPVSSLTPDTERVVVEANATAIANVRLAHRTDINRARELCNRFLAELSEVSEARVDAEELQELLLQAEDMPSGVRTKAREALNRILCLPGRTLSLKSLADSLKTLIGLEREAWDLKNGDGGGNTDTGSVTPEQLAEAVRSVRDSY